MKRTRKPAGKHFAMLPDALVMHVSVTTLEHAAFRVLVLLALAYRGANNGAIGLTKEQALVAGVSKNTLYDALRSLSERGLIEQTFPSSKIPPRPAMYSLSWLPIDDTEYTRKTRVASFAYRSWEPHAENFPVPVVGTKAVSHWDQGSRPRLLGPNERDHGAHLGGSLVPASGSSIRSNHRRGGSSE